MASASHCVPPVAELSRADRAEQLPQKLAPRAAAPPHGFLAVALDVALGPKRSWAARQMVWRSPRFSRMTVRYVNRTRSNRIDFVAIKRTCMTAFLNMYAIYIYDICIKKDIKTQFCRLGACSHPSPR